MMHGLFPAASRRRHGFTLCYRDGRMRRAERRCGRVLLLISLVIYARSRLDQMAIAVRPRLGRSRHAYRYEMFI